MASTVSAATFSMDWKASSAATTGATGAGSVGGAGTTAAGHSQCEPSITSSPGCRSGTFLRIVSWPSWSVIFTVTSRSFTA